LPTFADEPGAKAGAAFSSPLLRWNSSPEHWDDLLVKKDLEHLPPIKLGKSGFNLGGPLVNTFRRRHYSEDRTVAQKVLDLPILNLFVPGPMPNPPEGNQGRYFAWRGERTGSLRPAAPGGASATMSFQDHEPAASLISIGK
jgi:hypothetical protein